MPPCGQRLSGLWLLPIIKRKKRPHPRPWHREPGRCQSISGNAVAESDNIVAETAEKIFADLADAQTINRDNKGEWKAPLWQALTEAGLPLSWVAGRLRRLGRLARRRFQRVERGRALCSRGAARRDHAGRLAAGAGQNRFARRRDDGGAREPEGPDHRQCRWQPVGQGARRAVRQGCEAFCGARQRCEG